MKLASQPHTVRGVARIELRIQFVRRLEEGDAKRPAVALEAVAQRREDAVDVHPLAQIAEDLRAGPVAVQRLQLGPLLRLGLADEGEDRLGEDRTLAVEAIAGNRHVSVPKQVCFDDGLESGFRMPVVTRQVICSSAHISCAGGVS